MPKPSPISYNIFAAFFLAWSVVAGYVLALGDTAPEIRLAFAVCRVLTVYAATMGGWFTHIRIRPVAFRVPVWVSVLLVLLMLCAWILGSVLQSAMEFYRDIPAASAMRDQFDALENYVERHNGTLPPDMSSVNVTRYLGSRFRIAHEKVRGEPYVWNDKVAGRKVTGVEQPESVVLIYSQEISKRNRKGRVVLFLDGHRKHEVSSERFREMLRKSDACIAATKRSKPNAAKPANAVH